jgi:hypothetical protein
MAANKKPRKKYRPKIEVNTIALVLDRLKRFTPEQVQRAHGINAHALHELVHGRGSREYWNTINASINIALVLAEATKVGGYGYEYWGVLSEGQKALGNVGHRFHKWGKWQVLEQEERLLERALSVHLGQMEAATVRDVELAQAEVYRRVRTANLRHTVQSQERMHELSEEALA